MSREEQIRVKERKCTSCKIIFLICLGISIGLLIKGFYTPPEGVIDGSVIKGVGEMFAFAALAVAAHALNLGYDLRVIKGETTIEVGDNGKK